MSTYLIGDVQGCYVDLMNLLELISFNPEADRLEFVGDIVNRGPESLATLRFIKNLKNTTLVLGNHDLHLLAVAKGQLAHFSSDTFLDILNAKDKNELLDWLQHRPLVHLNSEKKYLIVHAGIPPQWTIDEAMNYAEEIHTILTSDDSSGFLKTMHGDHPNQWSEGLRGDDRLRYIVNAFTRMRFCQSNGTLDLLNKTNQPSDKTYRPWYEWRKNNKSYDIIFGHWASLAGKCDQPHFFSIDTGCVWGGNLTALRIEDKKRFTLSCKRHQ